ncbi:N-acetylmuramoyl-L-alanine amidase [Mangrovicoccus sp. HB161399]|uniref:N-acetylmuramoyl-L-alanine amidase n=1 Tax=Mangrovicoccus sp. HB161399 TaxID=2720392 RepID=UPI001554FF22
MSAVATTTIGGFFGLKNGREAALSQLELKEREVEGQLEIKRMEVEGQIRAQELAAEAERNRLEIEQKFGIIVQATKGLPPDVASENLKFFVDAGILEDPEGNIRRLAEEWRAPDLPSPETQDRAANPLLERLEAMAAEEPADPAAGGQDGFAVESGVVRALGGTAVSYAETGAHGGQIQPRYIVLHYTAGVGASLVPYLAGNQVRASAHLLVRRDGSVVQLLPLDFQAWHAGVSSWGSLRSFNAISIGISFENWGQLVRAGEGWASQFGTPVPTDQVFVDAAGGGWQAYPPEQVSAATALMKAIRAAYPGVIDILGHADIAPQRKSDPGPALPAADIREAVFGRRDALPPPP